ncbi:MAG: hypothetical protein JWR15_3895 [Prosthecobacter sp.]|nr:hypothetical protein [Prosthecobacter sp.]
MVKLRTETGDGPSFRIIDFKSCFGIRAIGAHDSLRFRAFEQFDSNDQLAARHRGLRLIHHAGRKICTLL